MFDTSQGDSMVHTFYRLPKKLNEEFPKEPYSTFVLPRTPQKQDILFKETEKKVYVFFVQEPDEENQDKVVAQNSAVLYCYNFKKVDEKLEPMYEYDVGQVEGFRYSVGNKDFTKIFAIDDDE